MTNAQKRGVSINKILDDPTKGVNESRNLISRLWRTILYDLNIGGKVFFNCLTRYLNDPNSGIGEGANAKNNHRGNLMKELGGNDMTWGNFTKGLMVLGVEQFEVSVTIKRKDKITKHIVFANNTITYPEDMEDLSRATIVDGFETVKAPSEKVAEHPEAISSSKRFSIPEGIVIKK